jgi:cytochrome c-type biogenesis protein
MPEDMVAGQVTLATIWLLGVSMGMTACTVTCLPFMGTWALGRASGRGEAILHTGVFLAGRLLGYTLLAALAGAVGVGLTRALGGNLGNAAIGGASIVAGLWLLVRRPASSCSRATAPGPQPIRLRRQRDSLPPLLMGAALSLTPCMPLASLLALAAHAGDAARGAALGLAFGLGAAMTPILLLVPIAGRLGREIKSGRAWLSVWLLRIAALVLILLGLRRLWPLLLA